MPGSQRGRRLSGSARSSTDGAEETSTQVQACFLAALAKTGLDELLDVRLLERLRTGVADVEDLDDERVPVLLAMRAATPYPAGTTPSTPWFGTPRVARSS